MRTIRYGFLLAVTMLLVVAGTTWGDDGPPGLFGPAEAPAGVQSNQGETGLQQRYVTVDTALLTGPTGAQANDESTLRLDLFDGQSVVAVAESIESPAAGKTVWQGRIKGQPDGTVTLVARENAAAGTIQTGGRLYRLSYNGDGGSPDGFHILEEISPVEPMEEHQPIPVAENQLPAAAPGPDGVQAASADDGSEIDVLVVYTPASRAVHGQAGIELLIDLAIAETNTAYSRSSINTRLFLAAAVEVSYVESSSIVTDLYRLQENGDGFLDTVHSLRDQYAADVVSLIEEESSGRYCGIAFLMTSLTHSFESHAFSVVDSYCATGYYSFGHELGHNMGSTHDHDNGNNALYPYSYGYWATDYSFRTIMAYNCPGGCLRVQRFSNPNVFYNGQPTGIAYAADPNNAADNARSINEARYTVANWRDSATRRPAAPSALAAVAQSPTSIKLTWLDNANNEEGFDLQRRVAGGSWAFIADLGDNTTQYVDQALAADTTYEYRIRSYAGNGTSDYSNVASATTPRYPELHMGEISGGGAVQFGTPPAVSAWQAIVSVGVHDAYHEPVMGATVSGRWSNGASGDDSCVTDVSGYCAVVKPGLGPGTASVTYSVLGITYGSDPYLPGNNHDPNGSGSVFTVNRPVDAIYMPMIARP